MDLGKTGMTYISTHEPQEQAGPMLPTKHGFEQFFFRPVKLDRTWIAKSSTPIKR